MEGADQPSAVSCRHIFRAIEYIVSLQVVQGTTLIVTVEDRLTADQWRGEFDARYVEDLTHKTGNFKQFNVFVSMLESAVLKGSSSVCLDLLTYADLESLRHNKPGAGTKNVPGARAGTNLNTKRYLILTYTVEFDRIHYPLPLPYVGKPDPVLLQDTIQKLREEIKSLKVQLSKGSRTTELTKVQKECERALQDKENLAAEFELYKREVKHTARGNSAKEIRILKKVVQNLESDLMKEKTKYQKIISKKGQENRLLAEELDEARANERNLKVRCKSLTNELAIMKRGSRASPAPILGSADRKRSTSRGSSAERPIRGRTRSRERPPSVSSSARIVRRHKTPSPGDPNIPRFDPTAYVKERQRKLKEAESARSRKRTRSSSQTRDRTRSSSLTRDRTRSHSADRISSGGVVYGKSNSASKKQQRGRTRSSSLGSLNSGHSSVDRQAGSDRDRKQRSNKPSKGTRKAGLWSSPDTSTELDIKIAKRLPRGIYSSTPEIRAQSRLKSSKTRDSGSRKKHDLLDESLDRSAEMSEIDARLNALQKFMKDNL